MQNNSILIVKRLQSIFKRMLRIPPKEKALGTENRICERNLELKMFES